jgi:hypothetical protein
MVVGKRLAERWRLPATIRDCIWLHGQLPKALPATVQQPRIVCIVALADDLVREQHLGYSGNYSFDRPREELLEAAGVTAAQAEQVMRQLIEHVEPRAKAMGLGQVSSAELYQKALAQANKELGRAAGQLEAKNRRLAVRARFFDALSGFQGDLRPDAEAGAVLRAIAQAAVGVLGVPCAAAFSLPSDHDYAELLICDEGGRVTETSLVDLPVAAHSADPSAPVARLRKPATGDGPVMAVGDELEWLSAVVSPRLPHDRRFWICLEAEGACIGGGRRGPAAGHAGEGTVRNRQRLVAGAAGGAGARGSAHTLRAACRSQPSTPQRTDRNPAQSHHDQRRGNGRRCRPRNE